VDIVSGTLCAKLETKNLSSASSCCISFGVKVFTPFEFECHAGKSASINWKSSIHYCGNPLSSYIKTYETSDGKERWHFVIPDQTLLPSVLPTPSTVTTRQDNVVTSINEESSCASRPTPRSLPDFSHAHEPNFQWGDLDGPTACKKIFDYCREAVHLKRNLFDLAKIFVVDFLLLN